MLKSVFVCGAFQLRLISKLAKGYKFLKTQHLKLYIDIGDYVLQHFTTSRNRLNNMPELN